MTFVIAELGVNWRNLNEADEMIREAAAAGADACKFQVFKPEFTPVKYYHKHGMKNGQWVDDIMAIASGHPRWEELNRIALDESAVRYLYWRCQAAGVEFMCTPMYLEAVDMLNTYVKRWKVRYADKDNFEIIRKCVGNGKKPLIVSRDSPFPHPGVIRMESAALYCCPEYPPKEWPSSLKFKGMNGYSCHIPVWEHAAFAAKYHKLEYLEVHVKRDHYPDAYCPIDNSVSITMSELAELCRRVK